MRLWANRTDLPDELRNRAWNRDPGAFEAIVAAVCRAEGRTAGALSRRHRRRIERIAELLIEEGWQRPA